MTVTAREAIENWMEEVDEAKLSWGFVSQSIEECKTKYENILMNN